jgi:tyrosyl-tRNA synthetase
MSQVDLRALEQDLLEHPDLKTLTPAEQLAVLKERAKHIAGEDRLLRYLERAKKARRGIRVKFGIDATGRELHLGHAIPLVLFRRLQKMGHEVTLVIGDFTAGIGDPSGRVAERPVLTEQEIARNLKTYEKQAGRIIDLKRAAVRRNSEWLAKLSLADFLKMIRGLTVASAMQREDFRKRESVTRVELLYASLTGIDSVELKTELEIGGDDQLLNFYDSARVMELNRQEPEAALTTDILIGTSGQGLKMSKSLDNYIALDAEPEEMFGKLMRIPDELLEQYFKLLTDIRDAQWNPLARSLKAGELNPMHLKRTLARIVVADLNDVSAADRAEEYFNRAVVSKKTDEMDVPEVKLSAKDASSWISLVKALKLPGVDSSAAAGRLLKQKAVHLKVEGKAGDGWKTVGLSDKIPPKKFTIRVGKRHYRTVSIG